MTLSVSPTADQGQSTAADAALLTVDEVAAFLSCSTRHVRRMADSGEMPRPIKLGSLIRWRRNEVDAWLQDGCPRIERRAGR